MKLPKAPKAVERTKDSADFQTQESKPLLVLCIDDEPRVSSAMTRKLRAEGIVVISATTAKQGYWLYLTRSPDVVITDLSMPEFSGVEVIENIRGHEPGPPIPIIVLTGMVTDEIADRLIAIGATAVMNKPATTENILREIGQALPDQKLSQNGNKGYNRQRRTSSDAVFAACPCEP